LQRFRVVVIGNNGQECAAAIERAPRIEREALMFKLQRLGDLFWEFPHPSDAVFLQGVVWAIGYIGFTAGIITDCICASLSELFHLTFWYCSDVRTILIVSPTASSPFIFDG
jgi:hypothetical protein